MGNWLDLHLHSAVSNDGELEPEALMELCCENGLRAVALTDHNSVRGVERAAQAARRLGLEFFPAAEFDVTLTGHDYHLLGYGIDPTAPVWAEVEEKEESRQREASGEVMELVLKTGLRFDKEAVRRGAIRGVVTGEMIAEACMKNPENDGNPLLAPYRPGGVRSDNPYVNFYWDFCSQGKAAFVPVAHADFAELVHRIQGMGGAAVLAHPGVNAGRDKALLDSCTAAGIDGIEVYSSYHDEKLVRFYAEYAKKNGLLATLGSDFHGRLKPAIRLGAVDCPGEKNLYDGLKRLLEMRIA